MKTIIHINRNILVSNRKHGTRRPVITVKTSRSNVYCNRVDIFGPSRIVYSPDKPLSCGAFAWIETEAEVKTS